MLTPGELRLAWKEIEPELKVGDIIMVHRRKGHFFMPGMLVQDLTFSYWSHAVLVFATGDMLPLGGTVIVEAFYPVGVVMRNVKEYTDDAETFDLGVLRYPGLTDEGRIRLVRSFMASQIDVPYDTYSVVMFAVKLFFVKWFRLKVKVWEMDPSRFACSTFAHRAMHGGSNAAHPDKHAYVPADLGRSGEFDWVFNKND